MEEIIARAERGELPPNEALRQRAALLTSSMRSKLSNSWVRLCNVFKSWDDSGDGMVTRQEFIRSLAVLGVAAPPRSRGAGEAAAPGPRGSGLTLRLLSPHRSGAR